MLESCSDPRYVDHMNRLGELARFEAFRQALAERPATVEIGSNRGDFAMGLAASDPRERVLSVEWRGKWVSRLELAARERGLSNLLCLRGDAKLALPIICEPGSIRRLFVLYPDPWWKAKHARRRLLDPAFLRVIAELLDEQTGMLVLKTDAKVTYDTAVDSAARVSELEVADPLDFPDERGWTWTNRERSCIAAGIATYRLILRRAT